ncbi:MAG: alpha-glucan family phosphorylase [Firmicutes bacterium]|nr:alpha-glucan family phosphorylase [Bacillota bacterium]
MREVNQGIPRVAYFCMEYGLHEEFQIYAGGLGILAGDHLKTAGDLGLPMVGIGLLWRYGYTTQLIGSDGRPYDNYPEMHYDFLHDTGVKVKVQVRGRDIACRVWMVDKYGNVPLYLLDADLPENDDRWITGHLYGGDSETRVAQEILLGIGGIRALRALGIEVDVYHFNEGHAVLAGIEMIRELMEQGWNFDSAVAEVRKRIVFTTHTPVLAGNESHSLKTLEDMGAFNGLNWDQMKQLGGEPFGMTVAGLRLSRYANAVAQLHGSTARMMWKNTIGAAPIVAITNGVHTGTWRDGRVKLAYETGADLWTPHQLAKQELINEIAQRTGTWLNPNVLLIGFARRAATYKRANLIFQRQWLIEPLLREGKVQLVFSGKAHPHDENGKGIISTVVEMSRRYPNSVVFLQNYDMRLGRLLTRGCDVWLNNPRRPQEASGTSGMKAAMNGILNLSVLDGWWPEGCQHGITGWQIGNAYEGPDQDENDLNSLYKVLLDEVIPTYYCNHHRWVEMMRASIRMSHYQFSAERMLKEYYALMYEPNDLAWRQVAAGK